MAGKGGEERGPRPDGRSHTARATRASDQLRFVADLGALAAAATDCKELLHGFGELVTERLGEFAVVELADDGRGPERTLVAAHDVRIPAALAQVERENVEDPAAESRTASTRRARIVRGLRGSSTWKRQQKAGSASTPTAPLRSLLTGPITVRGRTIGSVTVASRDPEAFVADDVPFWEEVGRRLGLALDAVDARGHQELIVDVLQRALLPLGMPEVPGFRCAARYEPAMEATRIGGDWWDAFAVDDELVVTVGDVVGHDLGAAAAMGWLRHAARAYSVEHADVQVVLEHLSAYAARHDATAYATAVLAFADPTSGILRYCCAGHPPPLLVRAKVARFLTEARNPPLGVPNAGASVGSVMLRPDDIVLLYTDGLYERRGVPLDDRLSELAQRAAAAAGSSPQQLCDELVAAMTHGTETADDIAIVAVRRMSS